MKHTRLKAIVAVLVLLAVSFVGLGATSQDVTVTADPLYIAITNSPGTWTLNNLTGSGEIAVDTIYYSNPGGDTTPPSATIVDGECNFTCTASTGSSNVDLDVICGDFTGGDANMTNSNTGSNGATSYGAYCWASGDSYPGDKVIVQSSGSAEFYTGLVADASIKWGVEIETQINDWTAGSASTTTMTITCTAS